ncbi:unnamed protein product [Parnassius apollo]|uniref:(apollo) hypothetical protein n=1 Tax=Parnassius apollo TaxID=110799 RepID=A0A8S3XTQ8_PARAO|nr:unnamed protein product [Parnassius apollo]
MDDLQNQSVPKNAQKVIPVKLAEIKSQVQVVEVQFFDRLQQATKKFDDLQYLERNTGTGLIYSKKGKPIAEKTVERLLTLQKHKCEQASAMCLRYIRVRNAVTELETTVRKLEKLGPGLYVAQYEQLYIDKQNYMNKIEERDDELIKHRTKCTEHNQILAHIREKMNHTDEVIDFSLSDLGDTELEFLKAREELGQLKNHRNRLRWSLEAERLKAGLLTRKDLLRDYQNAIDEGGSSTDREIPAELQKQEASSTDREIPAELQKQEASSTDREIPAELQKQEASSTDREIPAELQKQEASSTDREISAELQNQETSSTDREMPAELQRQEASSTDREIPAELQKQEASSAASLLTVSQQPLANEKSHKPKNILPKIIQPYPKSMLSIF